MPFIGISEDLFDRINNDFLENDDEDTEDGIRRLLAFYDEHVGDE
jgi:hypothetical protein